MCGQRRAMRYQQQMSLLNGSYPAGTTPQYNNTRGGPIHALVGAVANMALDKINQTQSQRSIQSPAPVSAPARAPAPMSGPAPAYTDMEKGTHVSEAPPAYERDAPDMTPELATREMSQSTHNSINKQALTSKLTDISASNPQILRLVEALTAAITAHQAGFGRRKHVRRAQKALRNEMYETEITRRQAMYGRLRCGERSEIWNEIKAVHFGH